MMTPHHATNKLFTKSEMFFSEETNKKYLAQKPKYLGEGKYKASAIHFSTKRILKMPEEHNQMTLKVSQGLISYRGHSGKQPW